MGPPLANQPREPKEPREIKGTQPQRAFMPREINPSAFNPRGHLAQRVKPLAIESPSDIKTGRAGTQRHEPPAP